MTAERSPIQEPIPGAPRTGDRSSGRPASIAAAAESGDLPESPDRPSAALAAALLTALVALAAALRLYRLDFQSLWHDELFSVVFAHPELPLARIVETAATRDVHPLGYPVLLHLWMKLFGATDLAARLLSALAGAAAIAVMFALGRAIRDRATGLVGAALIAVNAFHLHYSQEARSYALLFLAAALSYLALVALVRRPSWRAVVAYAAAAAAALHLHYFGLVLVGAQLLAAALLAWRRRRPVTPFFAAGGLVALAALPWLVPLLRVASIDEYWPALPGPAFAAEYFHLFFGESAALTALFAALLLAAPFVLRFSSRPIDGREKGEPESGSPSTPRAGPDSGEIAALFAVSIALSLAVPYLWSRLVVPMMQARYTMISLPALLAILALVVVSLPRRLRAAAAALAIGGSLVHLAVSGYYSTVRNEQWREAARWATGHPTLRRADDRFVSELAPGFQFYFDQDGVAARVAAALPEELEASYRALRGGGGGLWLLSTHERRGSAEFVAELERLFRKVDERRFHGAAAEYWVARARRRPRAGGGAGG